MLTAEAESQVEDATAARSGRRPVMRLLIRAWIVLVLTFMQAPLAAQEAGAPQATGARLSLHPGFTRLTVDLSAEVPIDVFELPLTRQVVVRLPPLDWRLPAQVDSALGAIAGFRAESAGVGAWRLVVDVGREASLRRAVVEPAEDGAGARLIVELADPDLPPPESVHPTVEQLIGPVNPYLPESLAGTRVVVIDPGHGGRDPGASGIAGAVEKEIVLAAALALRDALESGGGYKVLLTREDDRFLSLQERSDFAARVRADLFVSLHADAYHSSVARGASVYSISGSASDRQAAALSGAEGRALLLADIGYGDQDVAVGDILLDMMMDVTAVESARLAQVVVDELGRSVRLLDNSHRQAGYHVLKVPHTPAILVELGYLSNALDATDLLDAGHRQQLAEAIARGIHRYLSGAEAADGQEAALDSAASETP